MTDQPPSDLPPPATPPVPSPVEKPRLHPLAVGLHAVRIARRVTASLLGLAFLAPFALGAALFVPGPLTEKATVVIPRGAPSGEIAAQIAKADAVYDAFLFRVAARIVAGGALRAGEYEIPAHATPLDIARMIRDGRSVVRLFTVAEGKTSAEVVAMLRDEPVLTGIIDHVPPEGSLLPETYRYSYGDARAELIARMQKAMRDRLNEIWAGREAGLPLRTPAEAVALASVVEKETGVASERPRIAGVFYNRLRLGMRLQSDPTVIYALTGGARELDRALTHDDLDTASPINTYVNGGVPPQPICNPGLAALQAVAHPERHDYLYFVANGSGGHAFAADLAAHNANVTRWRQMNNGANNGSDK